MVCRASRYSSAMVTFARDMTGLTDNQVLSINHQLMGESEHVRLDASDTNWQGAITDAIDAYRNGHLTVSRSSHDPESRLTAALSESPDASRIYAGRRLLQRSRDAHEAQERYLERFARDTGISLDAARDRFQTNFSLASEHSALYASPLFVSTFTRDPDNAGISVDRRTMHAIEMMETSRLSAISQTRQPVATEIISMEENLNSSSGPVELRWSENSNHIEVDVIDDAEGFRTELYRAERQMVERFQSGQEDYDDLLEELRNNSQYHYASNREAQANRWCHRCLTCGQFANLHHNCPVAGAPSSIERDIALLTRTHIQDGEVLARHSTSDGQTRRYLTVDGLIRMPSVNRIQVDAREHDATEFVLAAEINGQRLDGTAEVVYNGYAGGYSVSVSIQEGDAGDRRLRCTCPEYEARRDCHHINILQDNLAQLINSSALASGQAVQESMQDVRPAIEYSRRQSEESALEEAEEWVPPAEPLVDNHEIFQDIYKEYRQKRETWQSDPENMPFPIEYQHDNAFGGLSTRENGRGFGIEIEFAFPQDMSSSEAYEARKAIAEELYDLGLTHNSRVGHYGAGHGWVRDQHQRGWSIEEDFTASGVDGQVPGEIISPIMYDEPETWSNIEKICEILKRHGAFASKGAGQHVHVSTGDYDHKVANHNRMLSIIAENEDLLYRLSVDPKRGRHRGFGYCAPNPVASEPYRRISYARSAQSGHNMGVNFQSVSGRPSDHAEFRMFDSSLEPALIQGQIGISLAIAAGAKREIISNVPANHHKPLGSHLGNNPSREALSGDGWKEQTISIKNFLDKYVPTFGASAKNSTFSRQIIGMFAMTKWQRRR